MTRTRKRARRTLGAVELVSTAKEHREIAQLIFDHDRDGAERAMTRHVHFDQVTVMDLLAALETA